MNENRNEHLLLPLKGRIYRIEIVFLGNSNFCTNPISFEYHMQIVMNLHTKSMNLLVVKFKMKRYHHTHGSGFLLMMKERFQV